MKENNFKGIMEHMNSIDSTDYLAMADFCRCLETAVGMMRLVADNPVRKMTLDDYQQGIFDVMRAAGALADNPESASRQLDLQTSISALLERLESHAALTALLEEHGETEENLDRRMSASLLEF